MTTPLVAGWRIVLPYIVNGFTHKLRIYVNAGGVVGSVQYLTNRSGVDSSWVLVAQGLWDSIKAGLANSGISTTVGTATLETLSGMMWVQIDSSTPTTGTIPNATYSVATQTSIVVRGTGGHKSRVNIMEGSQAAPFHTAGLPPGGVNNTVGLQWTSSATVANPPYQFQVGRDRTYLTTSPIAGFTITLNRKLRRRRGYL